MKLGIIRVGMNVEASLQDRGRNIQGRNEYGGLSSGQR
jgi:hypothetical protein